MNTWTITWMSIRFDSIDDALVTGESSSTGLYNRPRPLGPRPIQRWSNTYAAGGPANHKMWGSRELSAYPEERFESYSTSERCCGGGNVDGEGERINPPLAVE